MGNKNILNITSLMYIYIYISGGYYHLVGCERGEFQGCNQPWICGRHLLKDVSFEICQQRAMDSGSFAFAYSGGSKTNYCRMCNEDELGKKNKQSASQGHPWGIYTKDTVQGNNQ